MNLGSTRPTDEPDINLVSLIDVLFCLILFLVLIWRLSGSPVGAEAEALRVAATAANELGEWLRRKRQPL